jgi:DNA-binding LacI/PurR family transcriptional regulator
MKTRPRLKDVARLAGVSTATVSAVVTNSLGNNIRVSPDTQQRVWEAVARLGYVANPAARTLAGGKNRILGIFTYEPIFPFQSHDFFYPFLVGIEKEAEMLGYHLLLFTSGNDSHGQRSIYQDDSNLLYMADGSIILGLNDNKEELRRLQLEGYPFVYVGRREVPGTEITYVGCDYARVTNEMTCRLANLGHQRLVFIGVPQRLEGSIDRENGFLAGCREHGLQVDNHSILRVPASDITPAFMQDLLLKGFSGALIEMDDQCYAALAGLQALGLTVPKDFSIAMLGEPHSTWENAQDWTMFTMPRMDMGAQAVQMLIRLLTQSPEEKLENVLLPATVVDGQTIAPPVIR